MKNTYRTADEIDHDKALLPNSKILAILQIFRSDRPR